MNEQTSESSGKGPGSPGRPDSRPAPTGSQNSAIRLKKILVPVDFSECSRKALQYALPFARTFNASLALVYVVQENYFPGAEFGAVDFPALEKQMQDQGRRELAALVERELQGRISAETAVRIGQPADEIVAAAKQMEADLIILATHGHTGLKHVFLGSTAESVVRHAPCPVLVVRESEREFIT